VSWFKVSDDWLDHPKTQRAGKNGRALWIAVGNRCAKYSSDGLIEGDLLKGIAALAEVPFGPTVRKLVELGSWHDHETVKKCGKCQRDIEAINALRRSDGIELLRVAAGDYYFHDWAAHQLSSRRMVSPEARMAEDRSRALKKDTDLCRAIQGRDKSLCRYCGTRVNWLHRRGPTRATYDHVDPFCFEPAGGNFLEAVVTACGPCNSEKNQRTVEEWVASGGHDLKPAGWKIGDPIPARENAQNPVPPQTAPTASPAQTPEPDLVPIWSGPSSDLIQTPQIPDSGSNSAHVHGRAGAGLGPGQVGSGPGPGPGQVGLGRLGSGPGLAGLVRTGSGGPPSQSPEPDDVQFGDGKPLNDLTATDVQLTEGSLR